MSKRRPDVYLQDILESIEQIEEYLGGINEEEFHQNSEKQDGLMETFAKPKLCSKVVVLKTHRDAFGRITLSHHRGWQMQITAS